MTPQSGTVAVVMPALDEEEAVTQVVTAFAEVADRIVVVDNGSKDQTAERARQSGAEVVHEARQGYGAACLRGIQHLQKDPPDIVVFADCDGTIDPRDVPRLVQPILQDEADLVLGRRDKVDRGAFPLKNRVARRLASLMVLLLHARLVRDVPPLRAARWKLIQKIRLRHPTYGLPLETVAMALRNGGRIQEVSVAYRHRAGGESKVGRNLIESLHVAILFIVLPIRFRFRRLSP